MSDCFECGSYLTPEDLIKKAIKCSGSKSALVLSGALLNPLKLAIDTWQAGEIYSTIAGIPESKWALSTPDGGNKTVIYPSFAVRHNGEVNKVTIKTALATGEAWKIKQFRYNWETSLYDFIAERSVVPVENEVQTLTITPALNVLTTDILGMFWPLNNQMYRVTGNQIMARRVATGDITAPNAFATFNQDQMHTIDFLSKRPFISVCGDSISEGLNAGEGYWWYSLIHNALPNALYSKQLPGGDILSEPFHYSAIEIGNNIKYQNHSLTSQTWQWASTTGVPSALLAKPHTLITAFGTNDIINGVTWATVLGYLTTIKNLFDASDSEQLVIPEILPRNQMSDVQAATRRTWNANLSTWCTANGAKFITCANAMGKIRVSTGFYDDLADAYNAGDGVHLSQAGAAEYGRLLGVEIKKLF